MAIPPVPSSATLHDPCLETSPRAAQPALQGKRDILHLADSKRGRAEEERASPDDDDSDERAGLGPEALARPAGEKVMIAHPADAREQRAGYREPQEKREHRARLEPAEVAVHQHVENYEVGRRDACGRERKSLMAPPQTHGKEPVEEEIESDRAEAHEHR